MPAQPSSEREKTFEYRLTQEAISLRQQAKGMPPGVRRTELLQKARHRGCRRSQQVADLAWIVATILKVGVSPLQESEERARCGGVDDHDTRQRT